MSLRVLLSALLLIHGALDAQGFKKLPDWALPSYLASRSIPKPEDADDWVLLDRTEFAYTGDGALVVHHCLLVEVLTDQGVGAGVFVLSGLGGGVSKVKKLKGWNLRPDGDMVKLDRDDVVVIDKLGDSNGVTNERMTGAGLGRVVRGSVVAFESIQVETNPTGPYDITGVMRVFPIFRWEFTAAKKEGWFTNLKQVTLRLELLHFAPWIPFPNVVSGVSISADNIPALPRGESAVPNGWNILPRVHVEFLDPSLNGTMDASSWDGIASWEEGVFRDKAKPWAIPGLPVATGVEALESIHQWMDSQMTYKQVYLAPERGWTPLPADQVIRRRYGDCKDLASCFIAAARSAGFEAFPVLARIGEGRIGRGEPINPFCFNHVVAAIRLKKTLHLPSEVETPAGRFLLVDPTARLTPLGLLPGDHSQGRLMICAGGKGLWIDVPDAAVERPELHAVLTASADLDGRLRGTLKVVESANARGLRAGAVNLDPEEYQRFIFSNFLALPSNAHVQMLRHTDPFDVSKPFEAEIRIDDPKGFEIHGAEWDLDPMGIFRMVPPLIQRIGKARDYPVEFLGRETFEAQAEISVSANLSPMLAHRGGDTPFHTYIWDAQAQSKKGGGTFLRLSYRDQYKSAYFGFETKDAGVAEWAKYRHQMQNTISDALAFEVKP